MAFTIRITFSGMCLFVPEPVGGGSTGRMHVLMPTMAGHHHHHHGGDDRHVAALAWDAGHMVQGSAPLGVTTLAGMGGHEITLGSGDSASLALCGHIPDLREITQRPVDTDHLGADNAKKLLSRVTLSAGRITRVAPGVCWEWRPGEFRPIAHRVEWEIPNVQGDSLTLTATPLGGGGAPRPLGTLYPVDGRVDLDMYHETAPNMPPDPLGEEDQPKLAPGEHAPHFAAFYGLFGEPVPMLIPRYWGKLSDCPPVINPCEALPPSMGATAYACLVGGVGI